MLVRINLFVCALSVFSAALLCAETSQTNIVFVLADDLGWSDLGCYGNHWHETPNLDRLAGEGIRFTDAYAPAPICSASRASILTGKTPARLHFEFVTKGAPGRQKRLGGQTLHTPPFTLHLPLDETTIAEHLANQGYATAFFGKWHLNPHHGGYLGWSPTHGPSKHGFRIANEDFGSHPYSYRALTEKPKRISQDGEFPMDGVTAKAVEFLNQDHEQPFFLMVSHFYVHTPVESRCDWLLRKYDAKLPQGIANRTKQVRYAAFVETLDHYVGLLLDGLDGAGLRDHTLLVFTSDNGGHPEYASNAPLRGSKWNLYEGGIRVPMITRWPGHCPAGEESSTPVIGYDLLPTFCEVADGRPVSSDGLASTTDGRSLVDVLRDPTVRFDRELYWHFPYYHPEQGYGDAIDIIGVDDFAVSKTKPQSAIRRGNYKLIRFMEDTASELYDLSIDQGESRILTPHVTKIADDLADSLDAYLGRVQARIPQPAGRQENP
jgi:uncharacterized sulfatase